MGKLSKTVFRSLGVGFSRLDEMGGDARDAILGWLERSPTAARVRDLVARRGQAHDSAVAEAVAVESAARAKNAPPQSAKVAEPPLADAAVSAQIYGKRSCPWSGRAVKLLEDRGIEHQFVDLDDSENEIIANRLLAETKQNTVPYVFVRGQFVGGYNALSERDRLGQLEAMLEEKRDSDGRVVVEVAERPNTDEVAPAEA